MHEKMRRLNTVVVAVLLLAGCGRSTPQETLPASSTTTNMVEPGPTVQQIVKHIDQNVIVGEKTTDRIKKRLSEHFSDIRLGIADTNLIINVNCGDPIYHVTLKVTDGIVSEVTVGLTPICY
jgi:PBP1b-binding outer membrane lipoprotein LpoB